jgi:RNA polymerase sigma factor (sigma-70 family)
MSLQTTNRLASGELPSTGRDFEHELVALIPFLRSLARLMCGKRAIAEDMAQEALTRAWRSRDSFEPGTNIKAWLFTILRNLIYAHSRRAWRELQWDEALGEMMWRWNSTKSNFSETRFLTLCQTRSMLFSSGAGEAGTSRDARWQQSVGDRSLLNATALGFLGKLFQDPGSARHGGVC